MWARICKITQCLVKCGKSSQESRRGINFESIKRSHQKLLFNSEWFDDLHEHLLSNYKPSNTTHDGIMSSGRSTLTFTSFKTTTSGNDTAYQEMLSTLDGWLNSTTLTPLQSKQYELQKRWIREDTAPGIEFAMVPLGGLTMTRAANDTSYMIMLTVLLHPFSRGSVVSFGS